jgi:mutator protein MutT
VTHTIEAAVALVLCEERALVLRRRPDDRSFAHKWCLPGGRVEAGESPDLTAVREAAEETGLVVRIVGTLGPRRVALPERKLEFNIYCFVARADDAIVVVSDEHVDARWLTREEAAIAESLLPEGLAGEIATELLEGFASGRLS